MEWIKVEAKDYETNIPAREDLLVSNGVWVKTVDTQGWDKGEYYFHNGLGKLEGVTHFMLFPLPPKQDSKMELQTTISEKWINVNGREEHESILRDTNKMYSLGLDPVYEKMIYLRRWGSWLNGSTNYLGVNNEMDG